MGIERERETNTLLCVEDSIQAAASSVWANQAALCD